MSVINGFNALIYKQSQSIIGNNKSTVERAIKIPVPEKLNLGESLILADRKTS